MMETGRILKKDDVKLDGQFQLDLEQDNFESPEQVRTVTAVCEPHAQIIENQPDFAVIEVTCSCGAKVCLKCEYSNNEVPDEQ